MKTFYRVFFIYSILFTFFCCEKPNRFEPKINEVVKINPYFPMYKNTTWNYKDSSNNIETIKVNDYVSTINIQRNDTILDPINVNRIENWSYYSYSIFFGNRLFNFFTDKKEYEYLGEKYFQANDFRQESPSYLFELKYIGHIDSLLVESTLYKDIYVNEFNISGLRDKYNSSLPKNNLVINAINYYAKDIGIILQKKVIVNDSLPNDTVVIRKLVDYRIGAH
jgi:hypothetical protein